MLAEKLLDRAWSLALPEWEVHFVEKKKVQVEGITWLCIQFVIV